MIQTYHFADFATSNAIDGQFMLERFEDLRRPPILKWPHRHSFYEIEWFISGISSNTVDYHQCMVEPNTLYFISPGQLHLMSHAPSVTGYTLIFTEEFLLLNKNDKEIFSELGFMENSYSSPSFKLDDAAVKELEPVLQLMYSELRRDKKSKTILRHLLFVFINRIQRLVSAQNIANSDISGVLRYKQFKQMVETHFSTAKGVNFYADKLFLTPHRINGICKKITGRTAGDIIRERIFLEAKRLLIHSDLTVGTISEQLGFDDFSYFSRQFKQREGLSPAEYRKIMYEKYQNLLPFS